MRSAGAIYAVLAASLLVLAACAAPNPAPSSGTGAGPTAGPATASAPVPLRATVNWTAINGAQAGIWMAHEYGLFQEQGLDVELTHITSTSRVLQAMMAGELHLSTMDVGVTVLASLEGADVVMLFGAANRMIFSVLSQPSIQQPQELRGRTVGITRRAAASHTALLVAAKEWGMTPDRDFALRELGEASAILAGLQAGQIDAGVISSPTSTVTRQAGFRELINLYTDGPDYPSIVVGAPRAWVVANEEAVRRFARAYVLGLKRFKEDPAAGRAVYQKYFQIDDPTVIEQTYAEYAASLGPLPYISEAGLARMLTDMAADEPRLAGRQPADWLDTRFLRELEAAGFGS